MCVGDVCKKRHLVGVVVVESCVVVTCTPTMMSLIEVLLILPTSSARSLIVSSTSETSSDLGWLRPDYTRRSRHSQYWTPCRLLKDSPTFEKDVRRRRPTFLDRYA